MDGSLASRLARAGIDPGSIIDPQAAFLALVAAEGRTPVLDDRLALEALSLDTSKDALASDARKRAAEDFFGLRWHGFQMLGAFRDDPVTVVHHDPDWPLRFRDWRTRLEIVLEETVRRIEHVGSTSVPGLAAKPIIDIQVSVADLAGEDRYVAGIEQLGVALRSRDVEHRYFRPPPDRPRDVHIHVCTVGGNWEQDHLWFRDVLRSDQYVRDAYADLKRELARRYPNDRLAYTEGKTAFITDVLSRREG